MPNEEKPKMPFDVSTTKLSDLPAQKRLGRTSKFLPLFERLRTLKSDDALKFGIEKYTQIQGLRSKLDKLGFTITTRSDNGKLTAYIYHTPPESKTTEPKTNA